MAGAGKDFGAENVARECESGKDGRIVYSRKFEYTRGTRCYTLTIKQ